MTRRCQRRLRAGDPGFPSHSKWKPSVTEFACCSVASELLSFQLDQELKLVLRYIAVRDLMPSASERPIACHLAILEPVAAGPSDGAAGCAAPRPRHPFLLTSRPPDLERWGRTCVLSAQSCGGCKHVMGAVSVVTGLRGKVPQVPETPRSTLSWVSSTTSEATAQNRRPEIHATRYTTRASAWRCRSLRWPLSSRIFPVASR